MIESAPTPGRRSPEARLTSSLAVKLLLLSAFGLILLYSAHPVYAYGNVVLDPNGNSQQSATCASGGSSCATSSGVVTTNSNDIYIVICGAGEANAPFHKATDASSLLSYVKQFDYNGSASYSLALWYAIYSGPISSADVMTCSVNTGTPALKVLAFAVSGEDQTNPFDATALNLAQGTAATTATCTMDTTNLNNLMLSTVLAAGTTTQTISNSGWSVLKTQTTNGNPKMGTDYNQTLTTHSESVSWTWTTNSSWVAMCDAVQSQQTEQVTVTNSVSGATPGVVTITGCHPSISTLTANGETTFHADNNCSLTLTGSSSSSNRYAFSSSSSTTVSWTTAAAGSGPDTKSFSLYYQQSFELELSNNPVLPAGSGAYAQADWDGTAFSITGTQFGSPGVTLCTLTPTASTSGPAECSAQGSNWVDYGTNYVSPTVTGVASHTRWASPSGTSAGLGLDSVVKLADCTGGSVSFCNSNTLSAAQSNDVYVAMCTALSGSATFATPNDTADLKWTARGGALQTSALTVQEWYATSNSPVKKDVLTCQLSTGTAPLKTAFMAVYGANIASPFDVTSPTQKSGTATTLSCNLVTSNTGYDFLYSVVTEDYTATPSGNWSALFTQTTSTPRVVGQTLTTTSAGSATIQWTGLTNGQSNAAYCDAIKGPSSSAVIVQEWYQYLIQFRVSAAIGGTSFAGTEAIQVLGNQTDSYAYVATVSPVGSCSSNCGLTNAYVDYGSNVAFAPAYAATTGATTRWVLVSPAFGVCVGLSGCLAANAIETATYDEQFELTGNSNFVVQSVNGITQSNGPETFAWMFGYTNSESNYPPVGFLGVLQFPTNAGPAIEEQSIGNITQVFGNNVGAVRAVDINGGFPTGTQYAADVAYINAMYAEGAKYVYCRLTTNNFNFASSPTLQTIVTESLSPQSMGGLGCDAMWFDSATKLYYGADGAAGEFAFNHQFQYFANTFTSTGPNHIPAQYILNGPTSTANVIVALPNDTWQQDAWIYLNVDKATLIGLSGANSIIRQEQQSFGPNVALHWDNDAADPNDGMSVFAQSTTANEESAVGTALGNLTTFSGGSVLLPIFGGAYYINETMYGPQNLSPCNFYNSFTIPVNPDYNNSHTITLGVGCNRGTVYNFETQLLQSSWYNYGTSLSITLYGNFGLGNGVKSIVTSYNWDGGGNVPESGSGTFTVTQTMDATHALNLNVNTQYSLLVTLSPLNCGFTSPIGAFWENSGTMVGNILATAQTGCTFSSWTGTGSGSYTGSNNPTSITMNAPITETAGFIGSPLPACTIADKIVGNGQSSIYLLSSLFTVLAAGTVITGMMVLKDKDPSIILPLAFVVFLLGTVIIAVEIVFGVTSIANDTTLNTFNCVTQWVGYLR